MAVIYPNRLSSLASTGNVPVDGGPVRGVHFNRIFREISSIQSALGPGDRLRGSAASLASRLAGEMNTNGSLKREVLGEPDRSGSELGSTIYWDSQHEDVDYSVPGSPAGDKALIQLSYTAWDEPPVFFATYADDTDAWQALAARLMIYDISEVGASVVARRFDGGIITDTIAGAMHWLAVSREAKVWRGDRSWALPPVRTGGT